MGEFTIRSRVTRHAEVEEFARVLLVHEDAGLAFSTVSVQVKFTHFWLLVDAAGMSEWALILLIWASEKSIVSITAADHKYMNPIVFINVSFNTSKQTWKMATSKKQ